MPQSELILGIESSCDETAAALVADMRRVVSTAVHTQIPVHRQFGGVVPEIASRSHTEKITSVVREALDKANARMADVSAVAVTAGPGLVGALLVGVSFAKGLSLALDVPLIGVNHIAGHIAANYITYPELEPPFTALVASGGHSHIVRVDGYDSFTLIGKTRDDAAGEAFDKVARALGLPYPGGPELERLAREGDCNKYPFRSRFNTGETFDFSFSGIKTAAVAALAEGGDRADIAASFQRSVVDALTVKAVRAAKEGKTGKLALAGGVSANTALRSSLEGACARSGLKFYCPDMRYSTDNAAMIACQGAYLLSLGQLSGLGLNADPAASFVTNGGRIGEGSV